MHTTDNVLPNEATGASAPARASVPGSERRVLRVWVVDDNAALRELLAELLSLQPGLRCTRQFASAEALLATLAEERPPDLVLLDIHLGDMDGLSAIKPISKLAPTVKVVMMTMFSNSHYELEAFREGASGFLLKSYEIHEIVRLLHEAYRNPRAPALFPQVALYNKRELEFRLEEAQARAEGKSFSLTGALRRLVGAARRPATG